MELTPGTLLGGRVTYDQPAQGYRTGLEPVLLAAFVPARPGDAVLEAGCGAGAGLLCLATRVAGLAGVGLERDPALAALAARNFAANGLANLRAECADIADWRAPASFDHAFANPPWHDPLATASPDASRRAAKQAELGLIPLWIERLAAFVRPRGTVSLILPTPLLPQAVAGLGEAGCGELTLLPLWPTAGKAAKILIIRGKRSSRGATKLLAGVILHDQAGFTEAADAVLRHVAPL